MLKVWAGLKSEVGPDLVGFRAFTVVAALFAAELCGHVGREPLVACSGRIDLPGGVWLDPVLSPANRRYEDRMATTGEHRPTSGAWTTRSWPTLTIFIRKGDLMPPLDGGARPGNWVHSHRAAVCFGVRFGLPLEAVSIL